MIRNSVYHSSYEFTCNTAVKICALNHREELELKDITAQVKLQYGESQSQRRLFCTLPRISVKLPTTFTDLVQNIKNQPWA